MHRKLYQKSRFLYRHMSLEFTSSYRPKVIDYSQHTMAAPNLLKYLELKVHQDIMHDNWDMITVTGKYNRTSRVFEGEKKDKPFNWQRPTTSFCGRELIVECFPGNDYVHHYALIIATYLRMRGRLASPGQVQFVLPSENECDSSLQGINASFDKDALVILGWTSVHRKATKENLAWSYLQEGCKFIRANIAGKQVVYMGFEHSIWGDTAGRVVALLATLGAKRILYIGKLGGLIPGLPPNQHLAIGTQSLMPTGETVTWNDGISTLAREIFPQITIPGIHITSPSILFENKAWLKRLKQRIHFVDPEIGHMGAAAVKNNVEFGYLHIISNNLTTHEYDDLSNERKDNVRIQRLQLEQYIDDIIREYVSNII